MKKVYEVFINTVPEGKVVSWNFCLIEEVKKISKIYEQKDATIYR